MRAPPITAYLESVYFPSINSIRYLTYLDTRLKISIPCVLESAIV